MDGYFLEINGKDVAKKMLEFGDDFIRKMIKHNNVFLERCFSIMAPGSEHVQQTAWLY